MFAYFHSKNFLCFWTLYLSHPFSSTDYHIEPGKIQPTVTRVVTVPASYTGESVWTVSKDLSLRAGQQFTHLSKCCH